MRVGVTLLLAVILILPLTLAVPPGLEKLPFAQEVDQVITPDTSAPAPVRMRAQPQRFSQQTIQTQEYLIQLHDPQDIQGLQKLATSLSTQQQQELRQTIREFAKHQKSVTSEYKIIEGFATELTQQQLEELRSNPLVKHIEPNRQFSLFMDQTVELINATAANNITVAGTNVTGLNQGVCVIDSGVDYRHPDLGGCSQAEFLAGSCQKVPSGYDYFNDDANPMDDEGHGTHVAGTIAANGTVRGVAPQAHLIALKVTDSAGNGNFADMVSAIDWCVNNASTYNITSISMSLGTDTVYSSACDSTFSTTAAAIDAARAANIPVFISSGNVGSTTGISSPACIANATAVTASTKADAIATGYANRMSLVEIIAPGSSIVSTHLNNATATLSGTSMAAPHATGTYTLLKHYAELISLSRTDTELIQSIIDTGLPISESSLTYSRVNPYAAIASIDSQPPQTTATYPAGWQKENVTITFNATDDITVAYTTYQVGNNEPQNGSNVTVSEEGNTTVTFYSVDTAENVEATNTMYVLIDTTPPTTSWPYSQVWFNTIDTLSLLSSDELSGVASTNHSYNGTIITSSEVTITQEGLYNLSFQSIDQAGNLENITNVSVGLDTTNPTTTITYNSNWSASPLLLLFNATDALSGINYTTHYSQGGSSNASNRTVSTQGNTSVTFYSVDVAGNQEPNQTVYVLIDQSAPNLSITNTSSWSSSNVTVEVNATDALSGVDTILINGTQQDNITLSQEGNTTILVRVNDTVSNTIQQNVSVHIDTTPPSTSASYPQGYQNSSVEIILAATDALSGVAFTTYQVAEATPVNATNFTLSAQGNTSVTFYSVDVAGNQEPNQTIQVLIDQTGPSINNITLNSTSPEPGEQVQITGAIQDVVDFTADISINGTLLTSTYNGSHLIANFTAAIAGTYQIILNATDNLTNSAQNTTNFTVYQKDVRNNININDTIINATEKTQTLLRLKTNSSVAANLTVLSSKQTPSTIRTPLARAITHKTIILSENAKQALEWANISISYNESEVDGLDEETMRIARYNQTSEQWVTLTSSLHYVSAIGVDTTNNIVWANVTQFSTYALSADEEVPEPTPTSSGGGGGGGGGGGSAMSTSQDSNQTTITLRFLNAGESYTYTFTDQNFSLQEITFTLSEDISLVPITFTRTQAPADALEAFDLQSSQDVISQVRFVFDERAHRITHQDQSREIQDAEQSFTTLGSFIVYAQQPILEQAPAEDTSNQDEPTPAQPQEPQPQEQAPQEPDTIPIQKARIGVLATALAAIIIIGFLYAIISER